MQDYETISKKLIYFISVVTIFFLVVFGYKTILILPPISIEDIAAGGSLAEEYSKTINENGHEIELIEKTLGLNSFTESNSNYCEKQEILSKGPILDRCFYRVTKFYGFTGDTDELIDKIGLSAKNNGWSSRGTLSYDKERQIITGNQHVPLTSDKTLLFSFYRRTSIEAGDIVFVRRIGSLNHISFEESNNLPTSEDLLRKNTDNDDFIISVAIKNLYLEKY